MRRTHTYRPAKNRKKPESHPVKELIQAYVQHNMLIDKLRHSLSAAWNGAGGHGADPVSPPTSGRCAARHGRL